MQLNNEKNIFFKNSQIKNSQNVFINFLLFFLIFIFIKIILFMIFFLTKLERLLELNIGCIFFIN